MAEQARDPRGDPCICGDATEWHPECYRAAPHRQREAAEAEYASWRVAGVMVDASPDARLAPPALSGHMCGMQGFNGMTDECPACEANRRNSADMTAPVLLRAMCAAKGLSCDCGIPDELWDRAKEDSRKSPAEKQE